MENKDLDNAKMALAAKLLADCGEAECFRIMSYITIRLEYLHNLESLKMAGYREN
jgi:hypothetical protein